MYSFLVDSKTGFLSNDNLIQIFNLDEKPFYIKSNNNRIIYFNLPEGEYKTNNNLKEASEPRHFKILSLPKPNAEKKLPRSFKIYFTENPNKCSVDIENAIIYFDNSFRNNPEAFLMYIKLHELGHYFYSGEGQISEKYCDWFSYNNLIILGYNPSQVYGAICLTLSDRPDAIERKNFIKELAIQSI